MLPGIARRVPRANARQRVEHRRVAGVEAVLGDHLHLVLCKRREAVVLVGHDAKHHGVERWLTLALRERQTTRVEREDARRPARQNVRPGADWIARKV